MPKPQQGMHMVQAIKRMKGRVLAVVLLRNLIL